MNSAKSNKPGSIDPDPFGSFLIASVLWGMVLILVGFATFFGYKYFNMYITADPPGYCRAQDRYVPDEEFLKATLDIYEWESKYVEVLAELARESSHKVNSETARFKSYQQFHSVRDLARCCRVNRDRTKPILRRMFKAQVIDVKLYAEIGKVVFYLTFNECGVIVPDGNDGSVDEYAIYAHRIGKPITTKNYRKTLFLRGK